MERECPFGWIDCRDCLYFGLCKALGVDAVYAHRETIRKAAEIAEETVHEEAVKSARIISTPRELIQADSEDFWRFWAATSPPDPENRTREPVAAMGGAIERGGGSKSNRKKKTPKKKFVELGTWVGF